MAKRQGQWFGDAVLQVIKAGATGAEVIDVLPHAASLQTVRSLVFERVIIGFQTRRTSINPVEGYGFTLWHGMVAPASGVPSDVIDPNSLESNVWADKRIMQCGRLPVPGTAFDSIADNLIITQELTAEQVDVTVKRSVNRGTEGIFLKVSADASDVLKCFITWRVYYTYA